MEELQKWANIMLDAIKTLPQVRDSNTDLQNKGLEARVVIDRDTAARLGVTPQVIDNALYSAFGQRQVSTMYKPLNQYHVVMEAQVQFQENPRLTEKHLRPRRHSGLEVPLSTFIHYESGVTAQSINHQGQFPSVTLSFNLAPDVVAGRGRRCGPGSRTRSPAARECPRQLPGNGSGIPGLAGESCPG